MIALQTFQSDVFGGPGTFWAQFLLILRWAAKRSCRFWIRSVGSPRKWRLQTRIYRPGAVGRQQVKPACRTFEILKQTCSCKAAYTSEGECRHACRHSAQCWAYQYNSTDSTCYFAGFRCTDKANPSCQPTIVHVKYACEKGQLCVELVTDQWYLNGQYSEA